MPSLEDRILDLERRLSLVNRHMGTMPQASSSSWPHPEHALVNHDHSSISGGATAVAHADLSGLSADDHTIYLKEKASGGTASETPVHDHSAAAEAGTVAHSVLTGVTANQHHNQAHTNTDHTAATTANIADVGTVEAAGSSGTVPDGAHVHFHGDNFWELARYMVAANNHKGFGWLGPPAAAHTYANDELVGVGFVTVETVSGAITVDGGTAAWRIDTGATINSHVGFNGPNALAGNSWRLIGRFYLVGAANMTFFMGAKTTAANFADENGIIGFRKSGTGNMFAVCDSAGTETATDLAATFSDGWTRFEIRVASASIGFYLNNALVATITTNIPSGALHIAWGFTNIAAENKTAYLADLGYREAV